MARKSRKAINITNESPVISRLYKIGLYARLSVEDIRKKESDSIRTQKQLLEKYAKDIPNSEVVEIYEDINQTGTNFNRPGFNKLMEDIRAGKINCIVVKDLSRFGRNYIETGDYLENLLPLMKVRFIAINDNYDSLFANNEDGIILPIKNLINDFYARDISQKTVSQYEMKRKKGEFCGSFAPYGYIKVGNTLTVDFKTADTVRLIFKLIIEGKSDIAICKVLNEKSILPPNRYRYEQGILKAERYKNSNLWHKSAIKRISENPSYLGNLVQGRYRSNFMQVGHENGRKSTAAPQNHWVTVDNTHVALISVEDFNTVQQIRATRKALYKAAI